MTSPNVLLVVMDSVRARNTSLHGHRHDTTPFLSALSDTATHYRQARAPSQWSLPSHTSLFTGYHVREHGITSDDDAIAPGVTVFDDLQEEGYETGLFSENPYLTALDTGLDSGFDTVVGGVSDPPFDGVNPDEYKSEFGKFIRDAVRSGRPLRSLMNGLAAKLAWDYPELLPVGVKRKLAFGTTHGSTYTDLFAEWLEHVSGPWAACINYMDAHHPYHARPEFNLWDDGTLASVQDDVSSMPMGFYRGDDPWWRCEVLEHLYDGTVRQIDAEVERLVEMLRERDAFDDTLVVVTSDHGEGFGERSALRDIRLAGHNVGEHEVNLHVPLLVKHPGQRDGDAVDRPVTLTAIPDAIRRTVRGKSGQNEFPNRPVVARTQGLRDVQLAQIREIGVNEALFEGETEVRYERRDGRLLKQAELGSERMTEACIDATTAYPVDGEDLGRVGPAPSEFADADIKRDRDGREYDEAIEQRLKDLGYR